MIAALRLLIARCHFVGRHGLTPSDSLLAVLSQGRLDRVLQALKDEPGARMRGDQ